MTIIGTQHEEAQLAALKERFGDRYQLWFVPHLAGGTSWHAQPRPCLTAATAEDLAARIVHLEDGGEDAPAPLRPAGATDG